MADTRTSPTARAWAYRAGHPVRYCSRCTHPMSAHLWRSQGGGTLDAGPYRCRLCDCATDRHGLPRG